MKIFSLIAKELSIGDAQWGDWYAWGRNQGFHAFLGTLSAYAAYPGDEVLTAFIFAALKETLDLMRNPINRAAIFDSITDISFWCFGAWIAKTQGDVVAVSLMAFALLCGVIPRARRSLKK
jgi:hypothetical protein